MVDVVSPTRFTGRLDDVRVMDMYDDWEFDGIGRLPGVVSIPLDKFRGADGDVGMPPGRDIWTDLLPDAGVAADDNVATYDDTRGVLAVRFLVTALFYDHNPDRLHLLDNNFSAWDCEHETATGASEVAGTVYEITKPIETSLVDLKAVKAVFDDSETVIVDAHDPAEYDEGHLPDAVDLNWCELVDDKTRGLKPRDELDTILDAVGVTPDQRVVLCCSTARHINHIYVVLSHLGYDDVAFYEGSLTEWEERDGVVAGGWRAGLRLTQVGRVVHGPAAPVIVTAHVVDA